MRRLSFLNLARELQLPVVTVGLFGLAACSQQAGGHTGPVTDSVTDSNTGTNTNGEGGKLVAQCGGGKGEGACVVTSHTFQRSTKPWERSQHMQRAEAGNCVPRNEFLPDLSLAAPCTRTVVVWSRPR